MSIKYDSSSIEVMENLEAVRKRPGMYIGDTSSKGLHHLVKEIVDNSIDEHLAGFATTIKVTLMPTNIVIVEDDGRGVPVDIHKKTKKPAVETIFTVLHAGGKFGGKNSGYKVSGGLHGVGSSVVNALSDFLEVTVWKGKKEYNIKFEDGGKISRPLEQIGNTNKKGTMVKFKPSSSIFSTINFSGKIIRESLKELSYLNPGLKIIYDDKKNEEKHTFYFPDGIKTFVEEIAIGTREISKPYFFSNKNNDIQISVAFKYTTNSNENIRSYANNIITFDGGTHENAFKNSLTRAINEYASEKKLQQNGKPLDPPDVREGIIAIVSVYLIESYLQFEGQTKSKLSSTKARPFFEKTFYEEIRHYLLSNQNEAKEIIAKAYAAKRAREAAKRAREVSKELKQNAKKSFAGKLVTAQTKNIDERELFIVEGDSAGGSAKLGRDRKTQAILPLKGKIINTEKSNMKSIIDNEILSIIIHAIGGGLGDGFLSEKSNYGKIIIMTDADTDGAHIQALLLTFFYRYMKNLITEGKIFIALPPLFKITNKKTKKVQYAWSVEELNDIRNKNSNIEVQRYKGLGEMNYDQLWETTMNPKTRTLIKVDESDASEASKIIETLMGQDVSVRRKWIEENVEFSLEDDYEFNTKNNDNLIN